MKPTKGLLVLILAVHLLCVMHCGNSEVFTALSHVERLVNIELELSDALDDYIMAEEARLLKVKRFAEQLGKSMKQATENRSKFIGHPLNTFLMIRRLVQDWPAVKDHIEVDSEQEGG